MVEANSSLVILGLRGFRHQVIQERLSFLGAHSDAALEWEGMTT